MKDFGVSGRVFSGRYFDHVPPDKIRDCGDNRERPRRSSLCGRLASQV